MKKNNLIKMQDKIQYISFIKENRTVAQAREIFDQRIKDAKIVYAKYSSEFVKRECPICGSNEHSNLPKFHETYQIVACNVCDSKFVNPCPSIDALSYYYNECECNALLGGLYRSRHNAKSKILSDRSEFILNLIINELSGKDEIKILEIGCNSGGFLSELKGVLSRELPGIKFKYFGIDIDANSIAMNVDPEIDLKAASAESLAESVTDKFDLVLHFELIEHLQDPYCFMKSVRKLIADGGLHHFHTPNGNGFDNIAIGYNEFRPLAHAIFPPMHLQAFTPVNILHFAIRSGFKIVQIDTPGSFDVDIVKRFPVQDESSFSILGQIPDDYLALFQNWLQKLNASSHMRVTLKKS